MNQMLAFLAASKAANVWTWVLGVVVGLIAVVISVIVAMQSTKEDGGLGAIAGGSSESFFGKSKTLTKDRLLSRLTLILSIVFVVLVLVLTILVCSTFR